MLECPLFTWLCSLNTYVCLIHNRKKHNYMPKLLGQESNFHEHRHLLSQRKDGTPSCQSFTRVCARARTRTHAPHTDKICRPRPPVRRLASPEQYTCSCGIFEHMFNMSRFLSGEPIKNFVGVRVSSYLYKKKNKVSQTHTACSLFIPYIQ